MGHLIKTKANVEEKHVPKLINGPNWGTKENGNFQQITITTKKIVIQEIWEVARLNKQIWETKTDGRNEQIQRGPWQTQDR